MGEKQREVIHQATVHAEVGQLIHLYTAEVLDAADAAAHDAPQVLGLLPLAARPIRTTEYDEAGRQTVSGADGLVEFHEALSDSGGPVVLALHFVEPPTELAGQHLDAVADTDDSLLGGRGAVQLRLDARQRGAQYLGENGLQLVVSTAVLIRGRQNIFDGITGPQPPDPRRQLLVGEQRHRGQELIQPFLPGIIALFESGLERAILVGQLRGEGLRLLGVMPLASGALGGEPRLKFGHLPLRVVRLPVSFCLVSRLGLAQLRAGAQKELHAQRAGGRRRCTGDRNGYPL
ncbi:hypothetical protein [Streptomyces sp. CEV 2-1]|uniref:hypothetical protein n=1 Tax=Streptomyces sp. CEV 2-1 TaxID=2485153 RepID=UPI0021A7C540|nr:hypothetical protein [Streptomyces sp. CEV 2-1]